ncbi:hypothetical protein HanIR_Chr10g0498531 [Helianthus annuus]|nr:hypothetical protein HanIR_Chr10g0498531 [Helianthus annuus]
MLILHDKLIACARTCLCSSPNFVVGVSYHLIHNLSCIMLGILRSLYNQLHNERLPEGNILSNTHVIVGLVYLMPKRLVCPPSLY